MSYKFAYKPRPIPSADAGLGALSKYTERELAELRRALLQRHDFEILHVEPTKRFVGMLRYADGTDWDPGDGEGLYEYHSSGWRLLYGVRPARELLTANRTYYVATTGDDSNDGLSAGNPFLTIQKAVNVAGGTIDLQEYSVTIQVADGTYAESVALKAYLGLGPITIQGNSSTPTNVVVNATATAITGTDAGIWNIQDLKVQSSGGGGIYASGATSIRISGIDFGSCLKGHIWTAYGGAITASGNYTISGGAEGHYVPDVRGFIQVLNKTITISNTPDFTVGFCYCLAAGVASTYGNTFSGSATGKRYYLNGNATCHTNSGATYFPGNAAGVSYNDSVYF